jgi:hypothetical protein
VLAGRPDERDVGVEGGGHTDRSAADNGHLALFLLGRHGVGGRRA